MAAEAKVKTYTPQEAYNRTMHLIYELQAKVKDLETFLATVDEDFKTHLEARAKG